jgi:hypothetical protein
VAGRRFAAGGRADERLIEHQIRERIGLFRRPFLSRIVVPCAAANVPHGARPYK